MVFVGIDVSKAKLNVHVGALAHGDGKSYKRDAAGIAALIARIGPLGCVRVVCEATGGFEIPLVNALLEADLPIVVANPRQVRQFARAAGMAALVGCRRNPVLKGIYECLRAAGKAPKAAIIAAARKLLTILNAMMRDKTEWSCA